MSQPPIKVAFLMADYGHDPTETALPFQTFARAGYNITILTETGNVPTCDARMLTGWTRLLLGASKPAVTAYNTMTTHTAWQHPVSWTDPSTSLAKDYDVLFLPGGHEKRVRQVLDSARAQELVREFWTGVGKDSEQRKVCAAVCHGVQLLAHTKVEAQGEGKSVLHDVKTTALTGMMENSAFYGTRLLLGDYYKTYGSGTPNVEDVVKRSLDDAGTQWISSASMSTPLVVEDEKYNYLSGRWPGDAQTLADRVVERVRAVHGVGT